MLKCLSSVIIVFLILFTTGCQTNTVSNMFIPSNPSGMTLAQSVKDSLMESNDPVINQIHVESNQNVVILSGYVKKFARVISQNKLPDKSREFSQWRTVLLFAPKLF